MRKVSDKKAARVKSGGMRLAHNSTFVVKPEAVRAMLATGTDRKKAIAAADKWFSLFIRLRDSDANGIATCITSGRRLPYKQMDAGHYVSRAKQSTRYDERNVNAQSKNHNRFQGGHFVEHGEAIDRKHGKGTAEALRQKGLMRCSRTTSDFLFLADTYRKKVAWIKQHEPGKFLGEVDPAHILQLLPDALS